VVIKESQIRAAGSVHFVIHVGVKMNKDSNPIEFLIEFAWANGADKFTVNNAKHELKRLRSKPELPYSNIAWAKVNDRGDIYDLTTNYNMFHEENLLPLYANKEELKKCLDKNR
jgi:hypothetical protein